MQNRKGKFKFTENRVIVIFMEKELSKIGKKEFIGIKKPQIKEMQVPKTLLGFYIILVMA